MTRNFIDLTGKTYKNWTIISRDFEAQEENRKLKNKCHIFWKCKCNCGNYKSIKACYINLGSQRGDCGCSQNWIGRIFSKLTIVKKLDERSNFYCKFLCKCECGGEKIVGGDSLFSGGTKCCGCIMKKKSHNRGFNKVLISYKKHAKNREINFDLTFDSFSKMLKQNCFYCDLKPSNVLKFNKKNSDKIIFYYNGIDRVDSSKPYREDNCVACCKFCNQMKMDLSLKDFLSHIRKIVENIDSARFARCLSTAEKIRKQQRSSYDKVGEV